MDKRKYVEKLKYFNMLDVRTAKNIYKRVTILSLKYIEPLSMKEIIKLTFHDLAFITSNTYHEARKNAYRAKLMIQAVIRKYLDHSEYADIIDYKKLYNEILIIYFFDLYDWNETYEISTESYLSEDERMFYEHNINEILSSKD